MFEPLLEDKVNSEWRNAQEHKGMMSQNYEIIRHSHLASVRAGGRVRSQSSELSRLMNVGADTIPK